MQQSYFQPKRTAFIELKRKSRLQAQITGKINNIIVRYLLKRGLYARKKGNMDKSISYFNKILALNSRNTDALNNIGVCYFEVGKYQKALSYLGRACIFDRDIGVLINTISAAASAKKFSMLNYYCNRVLYYPIHLEFSNYLEIAEILIQAKQYKKAIQFYDFCLELNPDSITAVRGKGICLAKLGEYEEAFDCVRKILNKNGDNGKIGWELKGYIFDLKGSYAEAVDCYNRAYGFE